jgi:hypothetical protein
VTMHYLPGATFRPKDHRNPQSKEGDIRSSSNLGLGPLYLHNVGKLRCHMLLYDLDARDLAISLSRGGMLLGLGNLLPSMRYRANPGSGRAKRVSKGYVFSMGEDLLHGLGVAFRELICRWLPLLKYKVEII